MPPLITTILPTYRRPAILRRAIESILCQTIGEFRICVYDDASGDETAAVVQALAERESRISYVCRPANLGMFANQLDAMAQVQTAFFSFLHDDDVLLPRFYEAALEGFRRHPEAMFMACVTLKQDQRGRIYRQTLRKWEAGLYRPPSGLPKLLRDGIPHWSAILFRAQVLEQVGTIDEEVGHYFDHDFMHRVAARFPIGISKIPASIYVLHGLNYGSLSDNVLTWPSVRKMMNNIVDDVRLDQPVRDEFVYWLRRRHKKQCVARALLLLKDRRFAEAARCTDVLHHLGCHREAWLTGLIASACAHTPLPMLLRTSLRMRRLVQRLRWDRELTGSGAGDSV